MAELPNCTRLVGEGADGVPRRVVLRQGDRGKPLYTDIEESRIKTRNNVLH